jgi:hypothetical protein
MQTNNKYLAHFDVMGFKEMVYNNDLVDLKSYFNNLLIISQTSLANNTFTKNGLGQVANLNKQKVNCLHISDSILFWTNGDSDQDFNDIMDVCSNFYIKSLNNYLPVRGCLAYGEIDYNPDTITIGNVTFSNSSMIGKGLVDAYIKADSLEFSGCVIHESVLSFVNPSLIDSYISSNKICNYKTPLKKGSQFELIFCPVQNSINTLTFNNKLNHIKKLFTKASKTDISKMHESVLAKMNNTIDFIKTFVR